LRCPKCRFENSRETKFCGKCGAPLSPAPRPPEPSTQTLLIPTATELAPGSLYAGRYQVIEELGSGGMGRVYKVFDTEVREKLALKVLNPEIALEVQMIERFRNELKLARTISHRNICRMYDLGREGDTYYIIMEYVSGEDLKSFIRRVGALPVGKAVSVARQICDGLAEAHRVGVVHRDLKPQNIMIDRDGNARIMDFGIARSVKGKGITGAQAIVGTPEYMSPEQVEGKEADRRSDIYALGVVLFEMVTGRLPFEGETPLAVAVQHKTEPAPDPAAINPQVPEDLKRVVLTCLEKSRDARFQSVGDLAAELAEVEWSLPKTSRPLPVRRTATSKQITVRVPSKKVWIPAVAVLVAAAAFVIWQFVPQSPGSLRSIAVMGFKNQTGDPNFDYLQETIPNLLITSLEQSGHFRVTTWQRLKDLLQQTGREPGSVLDEKAGFEICQKDGIESLAVGFYTKAGETFVTDVKVLDAATMRPLKTAQFRGKGPGSILETQIDQISRTLSRGLGRSVLKLEKATPKIIDLATNSLEAYNAFVRGRDEYERFFYADAERSLKKAVGLDPTFAIAYLYLSRAYSGLSDQQARDEALEMAKQFSGKATEKERLDIEARYALLIENDPDKQHRILRELIEKYPSEKYAYVDLGMYYDRCRLYPEAVATFEKALALDPNYGVVMNNLAFTYAKMGDPGKAIRYLERYAALSPADPNPRDSIAEMYMRLGNLRVSVAKYEELLAARPDFYGSWGGLAYVCAMQENYPEVDRALAGFLAHAPTASAKNEGRWLRAFFDYLRGRWDPALAEYLSIRDDIDKGGTPAYASPAYWITGYIYGDKGQCDLAQKAFQDFIDSGIKGNPTNMVYFKAYGSYFRGWVDLKRGRIDDAKAALREIEPLLPGVNAADKERLVLLSRLLAGEVALAGSSVEDAVEAGEKIVLENYPSLNMTPFSFYNLPFLKDVLARAYWKKGDLVRAAAEYRKLMTIDPANQVRYLISPLYHYRLGRVLEEMGDRAAARAEYRKFLEYWEGADPDHPELADARQRLR
jgi:serine/threonine protein kinase/tetratricopeptide (TPR) repeat protein